MAPSRSTTSISSAYFAAYIGILYVFATCSDAYFTDAADSDAARENARVWYEVLLRSRPEYGFERGSRSHGKPTFIRFGKRNFYEDNANLSDK